MRNRRTPPFILPVAAFLAAGIVYALARGALTLKGLLIGLIAAAVIVLAAAQMNRGPYI
jgi:multisubunit Na+/H+ antiporter MnhE subunit